MNDAEQAAIKERLHKSEDLQLRLNKVLRMLNDVQGSMEVTEGDAVAKRMLKQTSGQTRIYRIEIGLAGMASQVDWHERMRPALAKLLREEARALQAEYDAL